MYYFLSQMDMRTRTVSLNFDEKNLVHFGDEQHQFNRLAIKWPPRHSLLKPWPA